jgi:LPPG:FO 2-phospho-L-lactate transferase
VKALADRFVVAISPIKGESPFSGPVGGMLRGLGYDISPVTIASLYSEFLDYLIIDRDDSSLREEIEAEYGIRVGLGEIHMKSSEDKFKLAQTALAACREGEKYGR